MIVRPGKPGRTAAHLRPPGLASSPEVARAIGIATQSFVAAAGRHGITPETMGQDGRPYWDLDKTVALYRARVRSKVDNYGAGHNFGPSATTRVHDQLVTDHPATDDDASSDEPTDIPPTPPVRPQAGETYAEARTRTARAQADKLELEVKARRGELVPREDVERALEAVALGLREQLMGTGARLAGVLAAERDARKVRETIEDALRDALRAAADRIAGSVPGAGSPADVVEEDAPAPKTKRAKRP